MEAEKIQPATNRQKEYLKELAKYHRIEVNTDLESLTRSEASRLIDKILFQHGRMMRQDGPWTVKKGVNRR